MMTEHMILIIHNILTNSITLEVNTQGFVLHRVLTSILTVIMLLNLPS